MIKRFEHFNRITNFKEYRTSCVLKIVNVCQNKAVIGTGICIFAAF